MKMPINKKIAIGLLFLTTMFCILGIWFLVTGHYYTVIVLLVFCGVSGYFVNGLWNQEGKPAYNQNDYILYRKIYRYASDSIINNRYQKEIADHIQYKEKNSAYKKAEWNALVDEVKLRSLM